MYEKEFGLLLAVFCLVCCLVVHVLPARVRKVVQRLCLPICSTSLLCSILPESTSRNFTFFAS